MKQPSSFAKLLFILLIALLLPLSACQKKNHKVAKHKFRGNADDVQECLRLSERKKFQEAVECLEIYKSRYPDSPEANDAELLIGDNYFNQKEWLLAAESYKQYIKLHSSSPKLDYAYYRAGQSYQKLIPKSVDRDVSSYDDAQENYAQVYRSFPSSPYSKMAQESYDQISTKMAKRNMYVANFYYKYGEYLAAIPRYLIILQDYPNLGFDEDALYRVVLSYKKLGMDEKARSAAQLMQEKFPNSKKTQSLAKKILGDSHG